MKTIAIVNQKGGSGKTTTAVNLAAALGELGKKVLVVDLDVQCSATAWLGCKDGGKGLLDVFTGEGKIEDLAIETGAPGVQLVPCSQWFIGLEKVLASEAGAELVLKEKIEKMPKNWDYLFVDCPPSLTLVTVSALAAVKHLIVPVETHVMALSGLASLHKTIEAVKKRLNENLDIYGILACRVNQRTRLSQEVIDTLRQRFGNLVFKTVIRENVRIAEAPSFAQPITLYDPRSYGAEDYKNVAIEMINRN